MFSSKFSAKSSEEFISFFDLKVDLDLSWCWLSCQQHNAALTLMILMLWTCFSWSVRLITDSQINQITTSHFKILYLRDLISLTSLTDVEIVMSANWASSVFIPTFLKCHFWTLLIILLRRFIFSQFKTALTSFFFFIHEFSYEACFMNSYLTLILTMSFLLLLLKWIIHLLLASFFESLSNNSIKMLKSTVNVISLTNFYTILLKEWFKKTVCMLN